MNAQNDSLRIYIQGLQKGEKYLMYYNDTLVLKINCNQKRCSEYLAIKLDSTMKEGDFLNIDVHRKGKCMLFYRDTNFSARYLKSKRYLIIKRDKKLKNKYALSYLWSEEKIKYYD